MARFPAKNLKQTAVYWGTPTDDGYGTFSYADPVEINCRWEDQIEVIKDSTGAEVVSHSTVYVGQDLDDQGMLYLGELDDLDSSEEANPKTIFDAYRILKFDKIPNIKGTVFERTAYL